MAELSQMGRLEGQTGWDTHAISRGEENSLTAACIHLTDEPVTETFLRKHTCRRLYFVISTLQPFCTFKLVFLEILFRSKMAQRLCW